MFAADTFEVSDGGFDDFSGFDFNASFDEGGDSQDFAAIDSNFGSSMDSPFNSSATTDDGGSFSGGDDIKSDSGAAITTDVDSGFDSFDSQSDGFESASPTIDTGFESFDSGANSFDSGFDSFDSGVSNIDTGFDSFESNVTSIDAGFDSFDSFDSNVTSVDAGFDSFDSGFESFDSSIGGDFSAIDSNVGTPEFQVIEPVVFDIVIDSSIIEETSQESVLENILSFSNPTTTKSSENVALAVDFGTNNPSTYKLGNASSFDNSLFSINSSSGELTFLDPPDFERPLDSNTDNIYQVEVFATDSLVTISDIFSVQVTNTPVLPTSLYDSTQGFLSSSTQTQLKDFSDWSDITDIGDGWHTFTTPNDLTFTSTGLTVSGVNQDILIDGIKLVYNLRKDTIDITAVGSMVTSSSGAQITNSAGTIGIVDYSLTFSNRSAAELLAAGFQPGHWVFATQSGVTGLLPDSDDIITIVDADGVDRSSEVAMSLEVSMQENSSTGLFTTLASVGQSGTDSVGDRIDETVASISLGAPLIEEDENLGGPSTITASTFAFTNESTVAINENTKSVVTLSSTRPESTKFTLAAGSGSNDNSLFTIDATSGALSFINAPDHENPFDGNEDGTYVVEIIATDSRVGTSLTQTMSITTNDLPVLPTSLFDSTVEQIQDIASYEKTLTRFSDWSELTGAAEYDGWYTFATPGDLTFSATGLTINSVDQDILIRGLEIVYNVRTQEIDVAVTGNMVAVVDGARVSTTDRFVVDYSLAFTDRSVDEAIAAGFSPGQWLFATMDGFGGLTPDGDDIVVIEDGDGVDFSDRIAMFVDVGIGFKASGTEVVYAGVGQAGTDSNGSRVGFTSAYTTMGTPLIEEDETLGGGSDPDSLAPDDNYHLTHGNFTVTENVLEVGTVETTRSDTTVFSLGSSGADTHLFEIDSQTGVLTFKDSPADFENPLDSGGNNVYDIEVITTDTREGYSKNRTLSIAVTNLPVLSESLFSSTVEEISEELFSQQTVAFDVWETFTGSGGVDGWYTFQKPETLTFVGQGLKVNGVDQDILVDGLKIIYNARTQLIDVSAVGNMVVSSNGERITNASGNQFLVDFSLSFTDRSIDEIKAAGFTPGNVTFATTDDFGPALLPDSDDIVSITDADGVDKSALVAMFIDVNYATDATTGLISTHATVGQSGTDSNGLRLQATEVGFTLGRPTIEEDENLGGDVTLVSGQPAFDFTNPSTISIDENTTAVTTLTSGYINAVYSFVEDSNVPNSNDLFTLDSATGELAFIVPPDYENPLSQNEDGTYNVIVAATDERAGIVEEILSITVNDVGEGVLAPEQFSSSTEILDSSTKAALVALETWSQFNYLAQSGIYTFENNNYHLVGGPQTAEGIWQDILLYNLKLVYDAKNQVVDVTTEGDFYGSCGGTSCGGLVYFDLQYTDHAVQEFVDAGFEPGKFIFTTSNNGIYEGIAPDANDTVIIRDLYNGNTDFSDQVTMQVSTQIMENTATGGYTAVGSVAHTGTDSNLNPVPETRIDVELGQPTVVEN